MLVSVILADMQSRALYNPHPESKCVGVFGLSMGKLEADKARRCASKVQFPGRPTVSVSWLLIWHLDIEAHSFARRDCLKTFVQRHSFG